MMIWDQNVTVHIYAKKMHYLSIAECNGYNSIFSVALSNALYSNLLLGSHYLKSILANLKWCFAQGLQIFALHATEGSKYIEVAAARGGTLESRASSVNLFYNVI